MVLTLKCCWKASQQTGTLLQSPDGTHTQGLTLLGLNSLLLCLLKTFLTFVCKVRVFGTIGNFTAPHIVLLEKAMAPRSSTLAWKIPWTEEPGRLQSMGSRRVGHD